MPLLHLLRRKPVPLPKWPPITPPAKNSLNIKRLYNRSSDELQSARQEFLELADADAVAYAELQRSWRNKDMGDEEKQVIQANALAIPSKAVQLAQRIADQTAAFLTICNPNIRSDAKAAIHLMAGAAHAAYHTALVNKPNPAQTNDLQDALAHIRIAEQTALK